MTQIQPLGDMLLVRPLKASEKTAGGIYLPASQALDRHPTRGVVVARGIKAHKEIDAEVTVIFREYSAVKVEEKDEVLLLVKAEDVLAVIH